MRVYFGGTTEIRRSSQLTKITGVVKNDFVHGPTWPDLTDNGDT